MGISIFKASISKTEQVDIKTASNIWKTLDDGYRGVHDTQMLFNFVHDMDLKLLVGKLLEGRLNQVKLLEQEAEKINLKAPERPASDVKTSVRFDEMTDKFVFKQILSGMLNDLHSMTLIVRTSITSDRLRQLFTDFLLADLKQFNRFYKYGKLKGWEAVTPTYKTAKPQENELLSTASAYHIWDHIRVRYYNLQLTEFFQSFAHDTDFQAGMVLAVRTLEKQINKLEQLAVKFEVPLPERPPAFMNVSVDAEMMDDKFMYQQLFMGIDNMVDIHMRAILDMTRNDDVRSDYKLFETCNHSLCHLSLIFRI